MSYSPQVRQAAKETADYIRAFGWQQGSWGDLGGPRCMMGAMLRLGPVYEELKREVQDIIKTRSIVDWNDEPGRTKEEVLAVFEKVAN